MTADKKEVREFFESPWFKDATQQLCADGWPTFVVPLNIAIRETLEAYDALKAENEILKRNLSKCQHDYWFMTNLLEHYSSNKEEAIKDCIERMKFRQPLFKALEGKLG